MPIRYVILLVGLLLGIGSPAVAQPMVDGFFQTQINAGAGTGGLDQLEVQVQLAARNEAFSLGNATLMLLFNDAALAIPSAPAINERFNAATDYAYHTPFVNNPGGGLFYISSTVTLFGASNRVSINLVLDIPNLGQTMPMSATPIVTLFFDILDGTDTANLQWVLPSSGDPNPTVIQQQDNATEVPQNEFGDSDTLLPVELIDFVAQADGANVVLRWETASETNNAGFEVQMLDEMVWETLGFVEGRGTTITPHAYQYDVPTSTPGLHQFRLKQVDYDGSFAFSPQVEVEIGMAQAYELTAPFPHPVARASQLSLRVKRAQQVEVAVYDALGRKVQVLFSGRIGAESEQRLLVEAATLQSGMYFVRAVGETFVATQRTVVVK